ncbi:MAG: hypothetical protein Q9169_004301 [Polycauliona sp. 2 TL-2023]
MARPCSLLRLVPFQLEELPSHPALNPSLDRERGRNLSRASESQSPSAGPQKTSQTLDESELSTPQADGRPPIRPFIKAILDCAVVFIDDTLPTTFQPHSKKSSTPAKTKVELLHRTFSAKELSQVDWQSSKLPRHPPANLQSEAWFARRSCHTNQQAVGTARFSEFDHGLRVDHCRHEGEYTPDVYDTNCVLEWEIPDALARVESDFADYQNITMSTTTGQEDFIVVQLPVEIGTLKEAFYSNGRNLMEGSSALKRKKPIMGFVTPLLWIMTTTSDAKGWLPMWAQKMGVPGAIAKDVDFLIDWIHEKRKVEPLKEGA